MRKTCRHDSVPALLRGSCGNWTWAKDNAPGKVCDSAPFAYEQLVEMEATQWSKELELEARRQSVEDGKVKFEADCVAKVMLIYNETNERVRW